MSKILLLVLLVPVVLAATSTVITERDPTPKLTLFELFIRSYLRYLLFVLIGVAIVSMILPANLWNWIRNRFPLPRRND